MDTSVNVLEKEQGNPLLRLEVSINSKILASKRNVGKERGGMKGGKGLPWGNPTRKDQLKGSKDTSPTGKLGETKKPS